jgi:hypothetical protein
MGPQYLEAHHRHTVSASPAVQHTLVSHQGDYRAQRDGDRLKTLGILGSAAAED